MSLVKQGGIWINRGLPKFIAINRKPERGSDDYDDKHGNEGDILPHGTKVLKYLVEAWIHSDRIVCADSYLHL
jgi:hypothetical protein